MSNLIHGRNLLLTLDGVAVAAAKSCELEISRDLIEWSSPVSGQFKNFIPKSIDWNMSINMLVTDSFSELNDAMLNGSILTAQFVDKELGIHYYGSCIITKSKLTGTIKNLAQGGISLQGTGELRNYKEVVDLTELDNERVLNHAAIVSDDSWAIENNNSGSEVVDITSVVRKNNGILISAFDKPVILLTGSGTSAGTIASAMEQNDITSLLSETEKVILPGETYLHRKHTPQHFVICFDKNNYTAHCEIKTL